jgi:hypothetical protein
VSNVIGQITTDGTEVDLIRHQYVGGALSVVAYVVEGGVRTERYATLSVNIVGRSEHLPRETFFAKDWSENTQLAKDALASGLFEIVEAIAPAATGYVNAKAWRIKQ